jgi:hypothetical protein
MRERKRRTSSSLSSGMTALSNASGDRGKWSLRAELAALPVTAGGYIIPLMTVTKVCRFLLVVRL